MSEPKMKSAWEIAMEKAEKLGKLSPEENQRMRQATYGPAGEGLAKKYLSGLPLKHLEIELEKYTGDDRRMVLKSLLTVLKAEITLDRLDNTDKALEAWRAFAATEQAHRAIQDIKSLLADYERAIKSQEGKPVQEVEDEMRRQLEQEGISGSALVINIKKSPKVVMGLENLKKEYSASLIALKEELSFH
jgi:hypothetical protein